MNSSRYIRLEFWDWSLQDLFKSDQSKDPSRDLLILPSECQKKNNNNGASLNSLLLNRTWWSADFFRTTPSVFLCMLTDCTCWGWSGGYSAISAWTVFLFPLFKSGFLFLRASFIIRSLIGSSATEYCAMLISLNRTGFSDVKSLRWKQPDKALYASSTVTGMDG